MSLTSSRVGLRHLCTIERKTSVSDGGGGKTDTWSDHLTDLPCRAWVEADHTQIEGEKLATIERRCISVSLGTDVTKEDRIAQVTDRGVVFFDGPMPIVSVSTYHDHLELNVRELA